MDVRRYVRESNLIEGVDSEEEDENCYRIWHWLEGWERLSNLFIRSLQGNIVRNQALPFNAIGAYRNEGQYNVQVSGHMAPHYDRVPDLMNDWLRFYSEKAKNPLDAHIGFERIHPFLDGNGRTGRMLLWWHEIKNGQEPTLFLASEKWKRYYPLFS